MSPHRLINIVDTAILGVAAFGRQTLIARYWLVGPGEGWLSNGQPWPTLIAGGIMAGAVALAFIGFVRGRWILKAFLIFVGIELAASLVDGLAPGMPVWAALERGVGMRYFFYPVAAWLAITVTLICDDSLPLKAIGVMVMALTVTVAIPADWALPRQERSAFHLEAKAFERARPGTVMSFPIRPMMAHQAMLLIKH